MNLFEELLEDYLPTTQKSGERIKSVILRKELEYSYLDINNKLEGRIRTNEIEDFSINDEIEVKIMKKEPEYIIVSKNALEKELEFEKYEVGQELKGKVNKKVKGGFEILIGKNFAFLPFSLSKFPPKQNVVGKEFAFLIKEKTNKNIMLSRAELLNNKIDEYLEKISVGDIVETKILDVLDFGLIVDLGVMTGFVHISELSWNKLNIKEDFKKDQVIEAKIIDINKENKKVKLSIKELEENPWISTRVKYKVGEKLNGKIKQIFDFGILLDVDGTDEAFMHISDISYRRISNISDKYNVGEELEFEVIEINDEKQRINVSMKALTDKIWDNIYDIYTEDDILEGKVISVQNYGIFLELENKLEVFIHNNELSWDKYDIPNYSNGDLVKFLILNVEKEEKLMSGTVKRMEKSPFEEVLEEYELDKIYSVEVTDILENGALVKLSDKFKGLIPIRELSIDFVKKVNDVVSVGDKVDAMVIDINRQKRHIILSMSQIITTQEDREMEELKEKYAPSNS